MALRKNPATVKALPASAKRLIGGYERATQRQLARIAAPHMRLGKALAPYQTPKGTLAVAHLAAKLKEVPDWLDWRSFCTVAARRATERRFGRTAADRHHWTPVMQASCVALEAVLIVTILDEAGVPIDSDVRAWAIGRWNVTALPAIPADSRRTARCGSPDPHGAHTSTDGMQVWCGGNIGVIENIPA